MGPFIPMSLIVLRILEKQFVYSVIFLENRLHINDWIAKHACLEENVFSHMRKIASICLHQICGIVEMRPHAIYSD